MEFVLNALTLGYRPLWSAERQLAGVQLFLQHDGTQQTDTAHLLRILREMWGPHAPRLLLSPQTPALLQDLLAFGSPHPAIAIEVRSQWLAQHALLQAQLVRAAERGVHLVWRGPLAQRPSGDAARPFASSLLQLSPAEAVVLMQSPTQQAALQGQMLEDIHSQSLARRALSEHGASAIAGWPAEDVLHRLRGAHVLHPSHAHVQRLLQAVGADQSLDTFEDILSEDPLLAYRFMLYANSAALNARSPINSLRRALVMLGYGTLQEWLGTQLVHASHEKDLQPIRLSTVMRAQITAHLLDAGVSQELRSEVYLCGLFSRLDEVLDEPLATSLTRLPLSDRIAEAAVCGAGPYAPSLQLAQAMEREDGDATLRALCEEHEMPLEHINRTLLRLVCTWPSAHAQW